MSIIWLPWLPAFWITIPGSLSFLSNPGPAFPNYPNTASPALNGSSTTIDRGLTPGVIYYLFAKYDGSNRGSVVWFVGDLSGSVTIPKSWTGLALSKGTLFKEEGGGGSVPDSGATAILLGSALNRLRGLKR